MMMDDTSLPVELFFAGRNLKDLDFFSKSDPFLRLSMQQSFHGNIEYIGRTETLQNTVNPNWKTKISGRYFFEMKQPIRIEVYDQDSQKNADFIGKVDTTLGNIMGSHHQTMILEISDEKGKKTGKVIVRAEKVQQSSHSLQMKWKGGKIANVDSFFDFWDKSDPYLKFLKVRQDNTFIEIAKTQVLFDNQEPKWKPISVPASRLMDMSNPLASFKVQCWDHEQKGKEDQFIGETFVQMEVLKTQNPPIELKLLNPKIKKPGKLILENFSLIPTPNFVDYLNSGLQLNLVTAIDFTASNGSPSSPNSLHYGANGPTQYQQVLNSIWQIISNYDSDKRIPAFGFGAKPNFPNMSTNQVSHCFPLSGSQQNVEINGFGQLMQAYMFALNHISFSGPTLFGPLLKEAFSAAQGLKNSYSYQIMLILTDGQIHDMAATKDIIVQNSQLPTSIIIVGIGNSDFANMVELDGDGGLFGSGGQKCPRDIVQFVPFNKFGGNSQALTQELLREIPSQVTQYFSMIGRLPTPSKPMSMQEVLPSSKNQNTTEVILGMNK